MSKKEKIILPEQEIIDMYVQERLSLKTIGLKYNCSPAPIKRILKKNNIGSRSRQDYSDYTRDLQGKTIDSVVVIGMDKKQKTKFYKCRCVCGKICFKSYRVLKQSTIEISCGCKRNFTGRDSPGWKGYKEIPLAHFTKIIDSAKRRKISLEITIEDMWEQWIKQNKRCAYTKLPLIMTPNHKIRTASLDRINSDKGYTKDNIQYIHKIINTMKMDMDEECFLAMCVLIANNHKVILDV